MCGIAGLATFALALATADHHQHGGKSSGTDGWPAPISLRVEGLEQQQQGGRSGLVVLSEPLPRFAFLHGVVAALPLPRGLGQAAYRITVRNARNGRGGGGTVVWDSKVVQSAGDHTFVSKL
jgi:hypothetical protein